MLGDQVAKRVHQSCATGSEYEQTTNNIARKTGRNKRKGVGWRIRGIGRPKQAVDDGLAAVTIPSSEISFEKHIRDRIRSNRASHSTTQISFLGNFQSECRI